MYEQALRALRTPESLLRGVVRSQELVTVLLFVVLYGASPQGSPEAQSLSQRVEQQAIEAIDRAAGVIAIVLRQLRKMLLRGTEEAEMKISRGGV
jgi:hypothetical protein